MEKLKNSEAADMEKEVVIQKPTWGQFVRSLVLEPCYLLMTLGFGMKLAVDTKFVMDRACRITLGLSQDVCDNLSSNRNLTDTVENYANNFKVYIDLVEFIPGAVVGMFLGSWCDRYGRKVPVLIAMVGLGLQSVAYVLLATWKDVSPVYFMLASIPAGTTGGLIVVLANMYSMAAEMSSPHNRTFKFALLELCKGLGFSLGSILGGFLYVYGFVYAYITSTIVISIAATLFLFTVKETVIAPIVPFKTKFKDFFDISNIIEGFRTCTKKRENAGRLQIAFLTITLCILVLSLIGSSMLEYLYVYKMFKWEPPYFTKVSTAVKLTEIAVTIFVVYFGTKRMKIPVTLLGLVSMLSAILGYFVKSMADQPWIYFLSCGLGLLGAVAFLSVRSIVSKLVAVDELGKVFAFIATFESLTPVVAVATFSQIYNASLSFFPGLVYLVLTFISFFPLGVFSWIYHLQKRSDQRERLLESKSRDTIKGYDGVQQNSNATIQQY